MNAYMNYDRAEEVRESRSEYEQSKSEWIRNKADELSKKWPELLSDFANPFLRSGLGLYGDGAQDAYADMVERICLAEATRQASENEFLNGTFREVA
ncbi:Uncharacterised protein [Serratia fonticola]|uniref:host nuclease inhibitor GamL n=1 Tax=Serratia fonticola TaxID=47917 RepID=UPI002177B222|nr:host nuclease inhibitor GamL [Serratia fonticola]CAI1766846.1 Uncharacterised protein [Serratia fonticola]